MNAKESLVQEIEQTPESLLPEILNFVRFLKYKHQQEQRETVLLGESVTDEYELLAEEGLKEVYDNEPEGLWENCLES